MSGLVALDRLDCHTRVQQVDYAHRPTMARFGGPFVVLGPVAQTVEQLEASPELTTVSRWFNSTQAPRQLPRDGRLSAGKVKVPGSDVNPAIPGKDITTGPSEPRCPAPEPNKRRGATMPANHRGGRPFTRAKQRMHELYGYVCHLCGHDGAGESDHLTPLKVWPNQPISAELMRPAHGANYPCPTCGRKCNQERGTKPIGQARPPLKTSRSW